MTEKQLHKSICKYIKLQYKEVYFLSDPSGLKMSIGMATELKATRSNHSQLDIIILEPNIKYKGLILEVKKSKSEVFKKDGQFRNTEHVTNQRNSIDHLIIKGYFAKYVFSLDEAIQVIKLYMLDEVN